MEPILALLQSLDSERVSAFLAEFVPVVVGCRVFIGNFRTDIFLELSREVQSPGGGCVQYVSLRRLADVRKTQEGTKTFGATALRKRPWNCYSDCPARSTG